MLLAIDVGNSNTVIGAFVDDELVHRWRVSTVSQRTPDEMWLLITGLLSGVGRAGRDIVGVVIASVVPPVTETLRHALADVARIRTVVIEPGVRTGLAMRVDNPREVGADRIANAVAVNDLYGGPAVVVDLGTAISVDAVAADGTFLGGAIAPGVSTAADALTERAARLPGVEIALPDSPVGRSTVTALQSGLVYGFAGLVDGLVSRLHLELGPGVTTVATGGSAGVVLEVCATVDHHDPALTLKGLRLVWERNTAGR
ncbi:MAG: type III pantothenate kinase [Nitriliruptoraceae bacterium]|nr:type III pantothenate kinase [Nitriliruptoraceae bacterium]